jgi:hypothetical protein
MSHWAEINNDNIVLRVLVGDNNAPDEGQAFMESLGGTWIKTSYNAATNGFRKNFAGIGYTYDAIRDAFIAPEPDNATGFNEETCQWIVPEPDRAN